jgi:hypothetical protein
MPELSKYKGKIVEIVIREIEKSKKKKWAPLKNLCKGELNKSKKNQDIGFVKKIVPGHNILILLRINNKISFLSDSFFPRPLFPNFRNFRRPCFFEVSSCRLFKISYHHHNYNDEKYGAVIFFI